MHQNDIKSLTSDFQDVIPYVITAHTFQAPTTSITAPPIYAKETSSVEEAPTLYTFRTSLHVQERAPLLLPGTNQILIKRGER